MDEINSIINRKDIRTFYQYLDSIGNDPNQYIVEEEAENGPIYLNLLHILAGIKSSRSSTTSTTPSFLECCVRTLLDRTGIDINYTGVIDATFGITAAHIAVQWHNAAVLKILIERGADLLICDSNGQNVQDYAEREGIRELIDLTEVGVRKWFGIHEEVYSTVLEYPRGSGMGSPFRKSWNSHELSGTSSTNSLHRIGMTPPEQRTSTSSLQTRTFSMKSSTAASDVDWLKRRSGRGRHQDNKDTTTPQCDVNQTGWTTSDTSGGQDWSMSTDAAAAVANSTNDTTCWTEATTTSSSDLQNGHDDWTSANQDQNQQNAWTEPATTSKATDWTSAPADNDWTSKPTCSKSDSTQTNDHNSWTDTATTSKATDWTSSNSSDQNNQNSWTDTATTSKATDWTSAPANNDWTSKPTCSESHSTEKNDHNSWTETATTSKANDWTSSNPGDQNQQNAWTGPVTTSKANDWTSSNPGDQNQQNSWTDTATTSNANDWTSSIPSDQNNQNSWTETATTSKAADWTSAPADNDWTSKPTCSNSGDQNQQNSWTEPATTSKANDWTSSNASDQNDQNTWTETATTSKTTDWCSSSTLNDWKSSSKPHTNRWTFLASPEPYAKPGDTSATDHAGASLDTTRYQEAIDWTTTTINDQDESKNADVSMWTANGGDDSTAAVKDDSIEWIIKVEDAETAKAKSKNDDWQLEPSDHRRKPDLARISGSSEISYVPSNLSLSSQATEVYLYKDEAFDVELLEERYDGAPRLIDEQRKQAMTMDKEGQGHESSGVESLNNSNESIASSIDELILKMTNCQLYEHLVGAGFKPGPVTSQTRGLYMRKANRMLRPSPVKRQASFTTPTKNYSLMDAIQDEINAKIHSRRRSIRDCDPEEELLYMKLTNYPLEFNSLVKGRFPFEEAIEYESMLVKAFDTSAYETSPRKNGSGSASSSSRNTYFCYLLLDPEITENLPERANLCLERMLLEAPGRSNSGLLERLDPRLFAAFILGIFYVGKGHNARAYQHFYEAFKAMNNPYNTGKSVNRAKIDRITSIWRSGAGPISLHCFNGITEAEALTREALMIEVLSLSNLTNHISGQYKADLQLNKRQRNILGTYLLFKAFIILLLNGERQVKMPGK